MDWCAVNVEFTFWGSFVLTGLVESAAVPYLGLQIGKLSLDAKAEILFVDQACVSFSLNRD